MAGTIQLLIAVDARAATAQVRTFNRQLDTLAVKSKRAATSMGAASKGAKGAAASMGVASKSAKGFAAGMLLASKSVEAFGMRLRAVGTSLVSVAAPFALIGGVAIKMATEFEASMTKIETLVGVERDRVAAWREEIMKIGPELGKGPRELADALFFITSAGIRGASEAMDVLTISAKLATIGLGETKVVANALTSAVQAYGEENLSAADAAEVLLLTVREGKLEADELAGSIGKVLPIAAHLGVKFADLGAFIATFTRIGVDAAQATTALRQIMNTMIQGTPQQVKALKAVGVTLAGVRDIIQKDGLAQALFFLTGKFEGNEEALRKVIPNIRAMAGALAVTGAQAQRYAEIQGLVRVQTDQVGASFKRTRETMKVGFKEFASKVEIAAIALGDQLGPALLRILDDLTPLLEKVEAGIKAFSNLDAQTKQSRLELVAYGIAAGPVLFLLGSLTTIVGNLGRALGMAAKGFRSLWASTTPVGLIIGGMVTLGAAVTFFRSRAREAQATIETINGISLSDIQHQLGITRKELEGLVALDDEGLKGFFSPKHVAHLNAIAFAGADSAAGIAAYSGELAATKDELALISLEIRKEAIPAINELSDALEEYAQAPVGRMAPEYDISFPARDEGTALNDIMKMLRTDFSPHIDAAAESLERLGDVEVTLPFDAAAVVESVLALGHSVEGLNAALGATAGKAAETLLEELKLADVTTRLNEEAKKLFDTLSEGTFAQAKQDANDFEAALRELSLEGKTLTDETVIGLKGVLDTLAAALKDDLNPELRDLRVRAAELAESTKFSNIVIAEMAEAASLASLSLEELNAMEGDGAAILASFAKQVSRTDEELKNWTIGEEELAVILKVVSDELEKNNAKTHKAASAMDFMQAKIKAWNKATKEQAKALKEAEGQLGSFSDQMQEAQALVVLFGDGIGKQLGSILAFASGVSELGERIEALSTISKLTDGGGLGGMFSGLKGLFGGGGGDDWIPIGGAAESGAKAGAGFLGGLTGILGDVAAVAGPIAAIAGPVFAIVSSFFKTGAEKVAKDVGKDFGVNISDALAQAIADTAEEMGDRGAAAMVHLGEIISEGIASGMKPDEFTRKLRDVFSFMERGQLDAAQATKSLSEGLGILIEDFALLGETAKKEIQETIALTFVKLEEGILSTAQATEIASAAAEGLISQYDTLGIVGRQTLADLINQTEEYGLRIKEVQEFVRSQIEKGATGLEALFVNLGDDSGDGLEQRFTNLGIVAGAMFQKLRAQGISVVEAMGMIGPALDAAAEVAKAEGLALGKPLADLIGLRNKLENNESVVAAAEGLGAVIEALASTGALTQESFGGLQEEAVALFAQLTGQGFTMNEALALMGPTFANILDAANQFGFAIDDGTTSLIEQADAAGLLEGNLTPMEQMVKLLERQVEVTELLAVAMGAMTESTLVAADSVGQLDNQFFGKSIIDAVPLTLELSDAMLLVSEGALLATEGITKVNAQGEALIIASDNAHIFSEKLKGVATSAENATEQTRALNKALDQAHQKAKSVGGGGGSPDHGGTHAAMGLVVNPRPGGTNVNVGEAGQTELIAPVRNMISQMSAEVAGAVSRAMGAVGGGNGGGQPIYISLTLPGGETVRWLERASKTGNLRIHSSAVKDF